MADSPSFHLDFQPVGRRGDVPADLTLLEAARELGVEITTICGGEGECGKCKIQLVHGSVTPVTYSEKVELTDQQRAAGYRLACQTYPLSDLRIHLPAESLSSPQRTQVEGLEVPVALDPPVVFYPVELTPPSLTDLAGDLERRRIGLRSQHDVECRRGDIELLRRLSPTLRSSGWKAGLGLRGGELVAALPPTREGLGLAFDLGTTKMAGYLVELSTGKTLASQGAMNPQISYGEDLITRLYRVHNTPSEGAQMQRLVVEGLNGLATELCASAGVPVEEVAEVVVVANTAMHHLLLGLPIGQLAMAPYVPTISGPLDVKARDAGLRISAGGYLHLLPNIAGFVGADHVAMILATGLWKAEGLELALDIGTNTEICLSDHGAMTSVSTASGPAFEGAHIKNGMRAAPGAIEHLRVAGQKIEYQTVGNATPVGICGSGILDALAQFYRGGILDRGGRMLDHPLVRRGQEGAEVLLAHRNGAVDGAGEITVTQKDVREVQLAKGAIRAGIQVLLETMNRSAEELDRIIIAGAFGSYIDPASAVAAGMLPPVPLDRVRQVGNAAGTGARMALLSMEQRRVAADIAGRVRYVELSGFPGFSKRFSQAIYLGE